MRRVSTRVLPEPAPARMAQGRGGAGDGLALGRVQAVEHLLGVHPATLTSRCDTTSLCAVAYSDLILRDNETLVLDLHPHWWYFAKALVATVVALAVAVVVLAQGWSGPVGSAGQPRRRHPACSAGLVWLAERYAHWVSTYFILTSDRIIYREGIFAKHGMEIPLQRINSIFFNQRMFERILGLGDLKIESAVQDRGRGVRRHPPARNGSSTRSTRRWRRSRTGATTASASRSPRPRPRPNRRRAAHPGAAPARSGTGRGPAGAAARRRPAHVVGGRPHRRAAPPPHPGRHHRRRVRGQEGPAARPVLSARPWSGSPDALVSLVPSATETLLAWGVEPVAVTRFCEQPDLPQVGGTKDPDLAAIVALEPDLVVLCEEENRRDDAEALVAAGLAVHVLRIDSVADVGPRLDGLAAAVGAAPSEPVGSGPVAADGRRRRAGRGGPSGLRARSGAGRG